MDEQQVRELVRQALARHLGPPAGTHPLEPAPAALAPQPQPTAERPGISHAQFQLIRPAGEVECLIEPTVICNHCGYCQCYGH